MKGVLLTPGWEKVAADALLRWCYCNDTWAAAFAWFKASVPGHFLRRCPPSVN